MKTSDTEFSKLFLESVLHDKLKEILDALLCGFNWTCSPQGAAAWWNVYLALVEIEKATKLSRSNDPTDKTAANEGTTDLKTENEKIKKHNAVLLAAARTAFSCPHGCVLCKNTLEQAIG